jgi:hypothetical protein
MNSVDQSLGGRQTPPKAVAALVNDREKVRAAPTAGVDFEYKCTRVDSNQ